VARIRLPPAVPLQAFSLVGQAGSLSYMKITSVLSGLYRRPAFMVFLLVNKKGKDYKQEKA